MRTSNIILSQFESLLFRDIKKQERIGNSEVINLLLNNYYLIDSKSLERFRKRLKKRVSIGIDKHYLLELSLLHSYIDHLLKIYL